MSDHSIEPRDLLISLVTAALMKAEVDAAAPDSGLIFRPEWRPTPRTRNSTSQLQGTPGVNQSLSWLDSLLLSLIRNQLPPPENPTSPSASTPPPPYTSVPPPDSASVPALPLPPGPLPLPPPQPQLEDAVTELLKKNRDVFDEVVDHPFPRALGKGTASLDGFRYYMIQDKLYLETCARLKMSAVATSPNFKDVETFEFRHKSSLEYVKHLQETCVTMLGIPESTINNTPRSVELDASERFYQDSLRNEHAMLGYYVVLLPCVLTYWKIAERLMNDPSTAKNVVYYPAWIVVNYDPSSVGKYTKFINENIAAQGGIDRWNYIFRIACQLEAKLFNTGLQAPTPFHIMPNGTYSIHSSSAESVVLAIENDIASRPAPSDKPPAGYSPSNAGPFVVGTKKSGGDNERWHVVATTSGYTFQNSGTGLYLGISTKSDSELDGRILQAVSKPYYWWINPVSKNPDQGSLVYQIYDSANLQYTLHADIKSLNSIESTHIPIIAHQNSEVSCQMWSFNDFQGVDGGEGRGTAADIGEIRQEPKSEKQSVSMDEKAVGGAAAAPHPAIRGGTPPGPAWPRIPVGIVHRREPDEKIKNIVARARSYAPVNRW
ncbi:hypothetical protein B0H12DRAFT_1327574 [Mycena haematopus]|nr:hypothetical protein B0H12DRAFT_1327574 [Mycena haematopus]